MKVAWVEGDDVTDAVNSLVSKGEQFESLMHGKKLEEWGFEPVCAQAYLGGLGIAEAFRQGADIVICGRVADAAPAIGAAAYVSFYFHGSRAEYTTDGGTTGLRRCMTSLLEHWLSDVR